MLYPMEETEFALTLRLRYRQEGNAPPRPPRVKANDRAVSPLYAAAFGLFTGFW